MFEGLKYNLGTLLLVHLYLLQYADAEDLEQHCPGLMDDDH